MTLMRRKSLADSLYIHTGADKQRLLSRNPGETSCKVVKWLRPFRYPVYAPLYHLSLSQQYSTTDPSEFLT